VEALDTRSGRAAQVRLVFLDPSWGEDELAELVARWCGLGCAEVCGVLDFGPHEDGWFLVLPPSLGVPLERWRMIRRPSPGGAARLAAAVGALLERVAAAGFPPDALDVRDLAIGPGPTPFLDRPLLTRATSGPGPDGGAGQRALARVLRAAAGPGMPEPLERWAAQADAEGFGGLAPAIEALRRSGEEAEATAAVPAQPDADLDALFDDPGDLDALLPPPDRWRTLRRLGGLAGILAASAAASALLIGGNGASAVGDPPRGIVPVAPEPAPATAPKVEEPKRHASHPRHAKRKPRGHRPGRASTAAPRGDAARPAQSPAVPGSSAPSGADPVPPAATSGGGTPLPAPGGAVTLPPPG